jgi:transcriptional pleiotropic regulator of transition state genes
VKNVGMHRKVDVLGRIVIPAEIRKSLALEAGDRLDISLDEGRIVLNPTKDSCVLCGARAGLVPVDANKSICAGCRVVVAGLPAQPTHLRAAQ